MHFMRIAGAAAAVSASAVQAASTFKPAKPPAIPLAVRSPYLSTWLSGDSGGVLPGSWPIFWTGQITGWQGFVRVDGTTYNWMGAAPGPSPVSQTSFEYTSTSSIFTFDVAGKVTMIVTFLSPVYPNDLVKQSLQFSYVNVAVKSSDGKQHSTQVYMDISGEWAGGDRSKVVSWDYGTQDNVAYHQVQQQSPNVFSEFADQANWGTWYLSTDSADSVTHKSGPDTEVRAQFVSNGKLDNGKDSNFRAISNNWPVFAFAKDLGDVDSSGNSVLFTIGVTQDQVINFLGSGTGPIALDAGWKGTYSSGLAAMTGFFKDFAAAATEARTLDAKISGDSIQAAGQDYATITTLAVRQAFGGLQVAVGPKQTYVFLKEISSDGDCSTVDVIFPAVPILFYLNPTLVKLLMDPLYENQEGGHYPNTYAIHDLGIFPNALGYPQGTDEGMPLEECGNMVIMTLGYAQRTGDDAYITKHWGLIDQWASYLVNDSLIPSNQLSTDDFAGRLANQTNLALKGIIGLKAISEMARRAGIEDKYGATADSYLHQWMRLGTNAGADPPHTTLAYGQSDTHGLLYNLYADRLLNLDFVDRSVYEMQSAFYPTVARDFGVPLDTRHNWTKTDWEMFVAAIASEDTRKLIHGLVVKFLAATPTHRPWTDLYDATDASYGDAPQFVARPVMGGVFALLALPKGQ